MDGTIINLTAMSLPSWSAREILLRDSDAHAHTGRPHHEHSTSSRTVMRRYVLRVRFYVQQ